MTTDTDKLVESFADAFYEQLKHGDAAHQQWLRKETDKFFAAHAPAFRDRIIASLCGDVEQDGFHLVSVNAGFTELLEALDRADRKGYMPDAIYSAYEGFECRNPASTVAALKARVAELEKDAEPEEFTRGIDAAAKMLDKMADDYSNAHAVQDPDTGVYEFGRGAKEDYYNTLRELADDIRSIVYAPGERENTAQTLKAAKDAALEQAAILLECEYAEDAKQKRRLDQIAQHIRDLKKRSL